MTFFRFFFMKMKQRQRTAACVMKPKNSITHNLKQTLSSMFNTKKTKSCKINERERERV